MSVTEVNTTVRERPLIFSEPMVRAILAGRKTQTRRVAKFGEVPGDNPNIVVEPYPGEWIAWWTLSSHAETLEFTRKQYKLGEGVKCPYGNRGDRLWVREAFSRCGCGACVAAWPSQGPHGICDYRAGYVGHSGPVWRSPIFMPRWASRITLEIESVKVERVQDISEADARAEGWDAETAGQHPCGWYRDLWCEINGAESWAANPWTWALTFKVLP